MAGRLADEMLVGLKIFKILYRLNYSGFYFVQYYRNAIAVLELHFSRLLSSKACFKVCLEVWKIWSPLFFMSIPAISIGISIPNDIANNDKQVP